MQKNFGEDFQRFAIQPHKGILTSGARNSQPYVQCRKDSSLQGAYTQRLGRRILVELLRDATQTHTRRLHWFQVDAHRSFVPADIQPRDRAQGAISALLDLPRSAAHAVLRCGTPNKIFCLLCGGAPDRGIHFVQIRPIREVLGSRLLLNIVEDAAHLLELQRGFVGVSAEIKNFAEQIMDSGGLEAESHFLTLPESRI